LQLRDGIKAPPASGRTDIKERTARFLIPIRDISEPAKVQRRLELKRKIGDLRGPLFLSTWDIELKTFRIEIVFHSRLAPGSFQQFESVEVKRGCHGGGNRIPKDSELQGKTAIATLLLSRGAKSPRSP
jgi:hypothetical protein